MCVILQQIASIAKGLSKAELHVLIELAVRAGASGQRFTTASSRELAERTGLARASVQSAIDSLNQKLLIYSGAGKGCESDLHVLTFREDTAAESTGPAPRAGVAQKLGQCGLNSEPVVAQKLGQGGPTVRPVVAQILSRGGLNSGPVVGPSF